MSIFEYTNPSHLLSLAANLSVFMFESAESAEFGYYIHGRSSITSADTSLQELQDQLHKEAGELCSVCV